MSQERDGGQSVQQQRTTKSETTKFEMKNLTFLKLVRTPFFPFDSGQGLGGVG